jgi:serine protease Do
MNRLWLVTTVASVIMFGMEAGAAKISLRDGSRVQAPILKKTDQRVVLDLGSNILSIPVQDILSISEDTDDIEKKNITTNAYYTEAEMPQISTSVAAGKYGDAVVVVKSSHGLGSGFFVNKKGYLITNFHVVKGSRHLTVTRFKQEGAILKRIIHRDVEIVATAPFHDLAVLKIKDFDDELVTVVWAPTDKVSVGAPVFVIGNPVGLERSVSEGVISQAERNFNGFLYHQVDAPVNPGNSGGPLFNSCGQVIGVVNMGAVNFEGLNFAIPVEHVKYVLDHLTGFAFDESNPESGFVYPEPPPRPTKAISDLKNKKK